MPIKQIHDFLEHSVDGSMGQSAHSDAKRLTGLLSFQDESDYDPAEHVGLTCSWRSFDEGQAFAEG